ncbi:MAG TPA: twin-arginine translocation pathway signal [Bradyrhizobium sp.]|nr:twin-arginine translocation pathway signal [Bradyrhizobium sp.]
MTVVASFPRTPPRADARRAPAVASGFAATLALCALGFVLSGCASMSDNESVTAAFADPAKYELWDCKQLETERKSLAVHQAELEALMAKAQTGTAGPLVAEMAYRNDYLSLRGQAHFAEEAWRKNKCRETPPGAATASAAAKPGVPQARSVPPSRSGSAVY